MTERKEVKLDGTATHKDLVTPFDAHEQRTRGTHVPSGPESPDITDVQQYPKAIAHDPKTGEPVIAKDADHEAALKAKAEEKGGE